LSDAVDWVALSLSLRLGVLTVMLLLPVGILCGRWLALCRFRGRAAVEAVLALPLVLPPTVVGFYLLGLFNDAAWFARAWRAVFGGSLAFSFEGLLIASVLINLPFAIQPMQRAFEAVPAGQREAAAVCGATGWRIAATIDLPQAWPGIVTAMVLCFAHTLGEFGVVLMVGGAIPGETRTVAIAIYDRVQAFDLAAAREMSLLLALLSFATMGIVYALSNRLVPRM